VVTAPSAGGRTTPQPFTSSVGNSPSPRRRPFSLRRVRRVAIVAVAAAGLGLFGTGVRGLAQIDGELADDARAPQTREVKRELGPHGDCPWRERTLERRRL
jgi:hypothetical protein